jgi:hypothetical protein
MREKGINHSQKMEKGSDPKSKRGEKPRPIEKDSLFNAQ